MIGLLNMDNVEGSLERQTNSTHYVSMWYIPGGWDYVNAKSVVLFFSNENLATAFTKKWEAAPEYAEVGPISDYDRIRMTCEQVYQQSV